MEGTGSPLFFWHQMIQPETIASLVEEHLTDSPHFLVEVTVKSGNRISVFLDGDQGVTIDVCREVNHFLNSRLDRDKEDYDLTVSSAGIDRPLKFPRQYRKNKGRWLEIILADGRKLSGEVAGADDAGVTLHLPGGKSGSPASAEVVLPYSEIKTAKEVIKF